MKILITEEQLDELKGQYKDEVEIIYRDKNLVCLIPKSQMTSRIFGRKTEWYKNPKDFENKLRQVLGLTV